eukprot:jgi/Ulvmu1/2900/UM146_0043.1
MIYGTMIGALTLALAASSVDARKRSFDDLAAGLDDTDSGKTTTTTSSSGSRRATARIVCSSEAWASTYSGFMDSYISAGTAPPLRLCFAWPSAAANPFPCVSASRSTPASG